MAVEFSSRRSADDVNARARSSRRVRVFGAGVVAAALSLTPVVGHGQAAAPLPPKPGPPAKAAPKPAASGVDTVIALVKGGMSESMVIRTLQREGKTYTLSTADLLKLQNAGVSEAIMNAMTDGPGAAAPTTAARNDASPPAAAGNSAGYPPDLPGIPSMKRKLAVRPFDYSTVKNWVTYWFQNDMNIGEGIRAMLTVRMAQSKAITLLERTNIDDVMKEQDFGVSNRVRKGSNARIGQLTGADAMLYGDIVIFGRDDTTKRKGIGAALGSILPAAGAVATLKKEEKAVVGINLRLVDTETGEVIETAEARGESSRTSKDYGAIVGVKGTAVGGSNAMTSSNFQNTIIGEATSNAVTNIMEYLETKIPQLPAKPRLIEGRVATLGAGTIILNVGANDGVTRGDRFEILQINGEIKDPATKEVIDLDAVKIGEFVADGVREKTTSGAYGGGRLSAAYVTQAGKGYAARLMVK